MRDLLTGAISLALALAILVTCAPKEDVHAAFPLEGQHAALLCETCHGTEGFGPLPSECAECHEDDRPPSHYAGDCVDCHNAIAWDPPIGQTGTADTHDFLPLVNAHELACESCHVGEGYEGLDANCESCHERPNAYHYADEECALCHAPTDWLDGKEHAFVLPHGTANDCADCHPDPAVLATATCSPCHDLTEMDASHDDVYGYSSDDPSCIGCHPAGTL